MDSAKDFYKTSRSWQFRLACNSILFEPARLEINEVRYAGRAGVMNNPMLNFKYQP